MGTYPPLLLVINLKIFVQYNFASLTLGTWKKKKNKQAGYLQVMQCGLHGCFKSSFPVLPRCLQNRRGSQLRCLQGRSHYSTWDHMTCGRLGQQSFHNWGFAQWHSCWCHTGCNWSRSSCPAGSTWRDWSPRELQIVTTTSNNTVWNNYINENSHR